MSVIVGWTSDDDHRPYSWQAAGADDPWGRWVPEAWIAVADPAGNHAVPPVPLRMGGPKGQRVLDEHAELLAWWAPLLHVTMFGLGWPRPDLGIQRWQMAGSPTEDPLLALINRWWGRHLGDFLTWAATSPDYGLIVEQVAAACHAPIPRPKTDSANMEGSTARWFGAQDEMHWQAHITPMTALTPYSFNVPGLDVPTRELLIAQVSGTTVTPRATLLLAHYAGWYQTLQDFEPPVSLSNPHGWRIDVICKPLGWLGQYRKSRASGRWFRGQHRWHQLGV